MGKLEFIHSGNFDEKVMKSDVPVLIDFYADWCAPCKMMEPAVEAVADAYKDKLKVYKLDVDENPMIAAKFHIMSIPTIMVFKDGAPVSSIVGAVTIKSLTKKLDSILGE